MKRIIIACLLAILVTAAPVAADTAPVVFNFTFTGIVETSNYATGTMVLNTGDVGLLAINFPGRYVWDPTRSTTGVFGIQGINSFFISSHIFSFSGCEIVQSINDGISEFI